MPIVMIIFESYEFKYYHYTNTHIKSMNFKLYLQYTINIIQITQKQDILNVYIRVSSIPLRIITVTFLSLFI